jgi:hypothetical protein
MSDLDPVAAHKPLCINFPTDKSVPIPDQTTTMIHPDQRIASDIPFQWNKLPEELKRDILSYVIPQKQSFKFVPTSLTQELIRLSVSNQEPEWNVHARDINGTGEWLVVIDRELEPSVMHPMSAMLGTYAVLLRVKAFASDARGTQLYNT